jgi:hypothetical protein
VTRDADAFGRLVARHMRRAVKLHEYTKLLAESREQTYGSRRPAS